MREDVYYFNGVECKLPIEMVMKKEVLKAVTRVLRGCKKWGSIYGSPAIEKAYEDFAKELRKEIKGL